MTNTNITLSLDTRRSKKDGTYPLIMRLGHFERTTSIPLGVSLRLEDWNDKNKEVKKSYGEGSSVTRLNNLIQKKKADAMDILLKLDEAGLLTTLSVTELRDKIDVKGMVHSFAKFAQGLIEELIEAQRIGTARSYKGTVSVLNTFAKGKDLRFQEINYSFLKKFEAWHLSKDNSVNGLAVYMRTLRAIFNKAIKAGVLDKDFYPFSDYKIKTAPTEKRALDADLLRKVITLDLSPGHICFHARNYFVASYMMYGMNFTDMAYLTRDNLKDGRIVYARKKTGKIYNIKISAGLKKILDYYLALAEVSGSPYVFPIIKRDSAIGQSKDIQWARKRYNKKLKEIAALCGIDKTLTSYVSRHSFATQAMMQDVPLNAISTMLGHSNLKTTEIYLKSLPAEILDDYNSKVIGL